MSVIPSDLKLEAAIAERVVGSTDQVAQLGHQVPLTCPDCGGSLWQMDAGQVLRFRCHTGHAFTAAALAENSQKALEESLWVALRMLEERKNLLTTIASQNDAIYSGFQTERADELKRHINRLREFLLSSGENGNSAAA